MLKKTMEIFRKVVNVFILCLICIKNFFFSQSWGRFSFLKRFIAEFLSVGGLLVLIKWAFGKKLQFNLLKNIFPLTVMVIIIEITRMVRRAEKKLYSLKKIKPHREAFKEFINMPLQKLYSPDIEERINATRKEEN